MKKLIPFNQIFGIVRMSIPLVNVAKVRSGRIYVTAPFFWRYSSLAKLKLNFDRAWSLYIVVFILVNQVINYDLLQINMVIGVRYLVDLPGFKIRGCSIWRSICAFRDWNKNSNPPKNKTNMLPIAAIVYTNRRVFFVCSYKL